MPQQLNENLQGVITIEKQSGTLITLNTEKKYVPDNIELTINVQSGDFDVTGGGLTKGAGSASISSNGYYNGTSYTTTDKVILGTTETSGYYKITATGSGTVNRAAVKKQVTDSGWIQAGSQTTVIDAGSLTSESANTQYYIKKSTTAGGTVSGGNSTVTPSSSSQTVTISEGYYPSSRTITINSVGDTSNVGTIKSGSATITSASYAYNSTSGNFNVTGSATISDAEVVTAGYVSSDKGTKQGNTANLSTTVAKIAGTASIAATTKTPVISKQAVPTGVTNAASGDATTTAPSSGVYVAVKSAANTATLTPTVSITTNGYGTSTNHGISPSGATVGAAASAMTYIPITTTSATLSGNVVSYGSGWITAGSKTVSAGEITSGSGTATISDPGSYDSTNHTFTQTATGTIAAPSVVTAGYISDTLGTKNGNSISGSRTLDAVKVGVTVTGTAKVTPAISRTARPSGDTWIDAASGAVTTTKPTSGAYVRVDAAAKSSNLTITGKVSSAGYGTTANYLTDTATTQAVGSNAASATYVPIKAGAATSGGASITSTTISYNSSGGNFNITGSADVGAPSITAGYIDTANSIGTASSNPGGATLSSTLPKIGIKANLSGTGTKAPSIGKHNNTNVSADAATTTQPATGYYVAVNSAANTGTVTATATVSSAGYGTTTSGQYTTTNSNALTVGAAASAVTYIPITPGAISASATDPGATTYANRPNVVLASGGWLKIDEGYYPATCISLATLVPDEATTNGFASFAEGMLNGVVAYDSDGTKITGEIATYTGIYSVT